MAADIQKENLRVAEIQRKNHETIKKMNDKWKEMLSLILSDSTFSTTYP